MADYGFVHDGKVYTPNGTPHVDVEQNTDRNAQIERAELARWAEQPDRFLAYYTFPRACDAREARATFFPVLSGDFLAYVATWPGTKIGRIISARVYTHNLGGRFVSIRVRGNNGAEYYGRASWDNGSCVWLRKARTRTRR